MNRKMKMYDVVFSLGADCACATYMKRHGLRSCAGPFDWLTHATLETRVQLVVNDFEDFLDISDLRRLPENGSITSDNGCDCYENTKNGLYFFHDFKTGIDFKRAYHDVRAKYARRISRFYKTIADSNRVLLIWFAHNHSNFDGIESFHRALEEKFSKRIDFVCIENDSGSVDGEVECIALNERLKYYRLRTVAFDAAGMPTTLGRTESCDPVFAQFALRRPVMERVKGALLRAVQNLLCSFVPVRKYRRKIREGFTNKLKYS